MSNDDLDTLRPEVQKALDDLSYFLTGTHNHDDFYTIRAELLRLQSTESRANEWQLRAERAEAELAEAQNTIAAQQGTMGALKRKLALAEGELAALKARIAEAPVASVRVDDRMHVSIGARSNAVDFVPLHTKHVALVKEEE